jgi:predicted nucleotide-binding protein
MEETRVNLIVPRSEANTKISGHIKKGKELLQQSISTEEELTTAWNLRRKWMDYARELLTQLFNTDSVAKSMSRGSVILTRGAPFLARVKNFRDDFGGDITSLESVEERLPLIPEAEGTTIAPGKVAKKEGLTNKVFVVHGRDAGTKSEVARFLEKISLEPIILHEQANEGKTIIEKFEDYSNETGYAIVILSPDDIGSLADEQDKTSPRARQNVVFEWGYFVGKLGRDRVNALHFRGVERPSDYDGVLYTPYDSDGAWQVLLARELKRAGYDVDLNKLVNS